MEGDELHPQPKAKDEPEGSGTVAEYDVESTEDVLNSSADWMERMIPTTATTTAAAGPTDSKQQQTDEDRANKKTPQPSASRDRSPGAETVAFSGGDGLPRFKDQVHDEPFATTSTRTAAASDKDEQTSPTKNRAASRPGSEAVAFAATGDGLPQFKDQVNDRPAAAAAAAAGPCPLPASDAGILNTQGEDETRPPPKGTDTSSPSTQPPKRGPDLYPGAVAVQESGPRFKDQAQSARRSDEDAVDLAAALEEDASASSAVADMSCDGSDVRSAVDEKDGEEDYKIGVAAATGAGAVAASASTWEGPRYKDQVNDASGRAADKTQSSSSDSGPRFKDQVQGDTTAPDPTEASGDEESKDCIVDDDEEQQQGALTDNDNKEEQERSAMLLHAEVVEDENDVRDRILKEAVHAEVVDESKAKRRRILCGILLVCLVAAIVGGSVAGTVNRGSSALPAAPTMAPTSSPTSYPIGIFGNDICEDATRVKLNGGTEFMFDDLGSATPDLDAINCLKDDPRPIRGRWYTFRGNGLAMTINLCTSSGQIRTPLILTGRCEILSCTSDFDATFRTDVTSSCVIWEQLVFTPTQDTQYWIFVYSNTELIDEASYQLSVSSNDACIGALDIITSDGRARLSGSTEFAATDTTDSCTATSSFVAPGVWFRWQGSGTLVKLETCDNNAFAAELTVYKGDCNNLDCVSTEYESCGEQSRVLWFAEEGELYHVLLHGTDHGSKGPFTLTVTETEGYTRCEFANVLDVSIQSYTGSTLDAEFPRGPIASVCGSGVASSRGVWYSFVGTGSAINLSLCDDPATGGASLAIFTGPSCDKTTCLNATDYGCSDFGERSGVSWLAEENIQYYIFVYDFEGMGDFVLDLLQLAPTPAPLPSPQVITTPQPSAAACTLEISEWCILADFQGDCSSYQPRTSHFFDPFEFTSFSEAIKFLVTVSVPENSGRTVVLKNLTSTTNYAGILDASDQVAGVSLGPGEFHVTEISGEIDFSIRREYSSSYYVEGTAANGDLCEGFGSTTYVLGEDSIPTASPSSSFEPTPILDEVGACDISAKLSCDGCVGNRPNSTVCTSEIPTTLWFDWTAKPCNESTYSGRFVTCRDFNVTALQFWTEILVAVHIEDKTNGRPVFIGIYPDGLPVRLDLYNDTIATEVLKITVSDITEVGLGETPGTPIQVVEMGVDCGKELNDISLLTHYGALQLVGFETRLQGEQRALEYVDFQLTVLNRGNSPAEITALSMSIPELETVGDGLSKMGTIISVNREETFAWYSFGLDVLNYPARQPLSARIEAINVFSELPCVAWVALALPY